MSGAATFLINNPLPAISSLSPASTLLGGAAFTLTVNGSNFVSGAAIKWNGVALTSTYVSATQITAQVRPATLPVPVRPASRSATRPLAAALRARHGSRSKSGASDQLALACQPRSPVGAHSRSRSTAAALSAAPSVTERRGAHQQLRQRDPGHRNRCRPATSPTPALPALASPTRLPGGTSGPRLSRSTNKPRDEYHYAAPLG